MLEEEDMSKEKVKNIRVEVFNEDKDIFIGRGSKWGNPFVIGKDGDRNLVIEKYIEYFENNDELKKDIEELKDKNLVCYCAPEACHGDYLLKKVEDVVWDFNMGEFTVRFNKWGNRQ